MRLAFLGSPPAAVPALRSLVEAGHEVVLVVSQPDRRRGRGGALVPSAVKRAATEMGLPVTDLVDAVLEAKAELGVVVAFGRLIKPHVLEAVPMVNLHFSLLPRWRGAAPVERAILAGDDVTGVCLMALDEGIDTGPVYDRVETAVGADETADDLRDRLAAMGAGLLVARLHRGLGAAEAQIGEPTYAAKLDAAELELDWSQPAERVQRVIRLGRAWTSFRAKRLLVLRATLAVDGPAAGELRGLTVGCGDGRGIELVVVQPEGKGPLPASAWRNGARPADGERFG